jgi:hypothetical protein
VVALLLVVLLLILEVDTVPEVVTDTDPVPVPECDRLTVGVTVGDSEGLSVPVGLFDGVLVTDTELDTELLSVLLTLLLVVIDTELLVVIDTVLLTVIDTVLLVVIDTVLLVVIETLLLNEGDTVSEVVGRADCANAPATIKAMKKIIFEVMVAVDQKMNRPPLKNDDLKDQF